MIRNARAALSANFCARNENSPRDQFACGGRCGKARRGFGAASAGTRARRRRTAPARRKHTVPNRAGGTRNPRARLRRGNERLFAAARFPADAVPAEMRRRPRPSFPRAILGRLRQNAFRRENAADHDGAFHEQPPPRHSVLPLFRQIRLRSLCENRMLRRNRKNHFNSIPSHARKHFLYSERRWRG